MLNNNEVQDSVEHTECLKAEVFENAKQESERNVLKKFLLLIFLPMSLLPVILDTVFPCTSRGMYSLNCVLLQVLSNITGY